MCQKAHGAAFATYFFVKSDKFHWTSNTDTIVSYDSGLLVRSACGQCGSVVPYAASNTDDWVAPAGCHDHGPKTDADIFVLDAAPWHTVTGDLPRHDAYPATKNFPTIDSSVLPPTPDGVIRGSCLCKTVTFQVTEPFKVAHNCHCSRCRRGRAAAHASNGFTSMDGVQFLTGEDHLKSYKVPDARYFTQAFCDVCCSLMPRLDTERKIAVIPLGALDDDPGVKPVDHIFVADKADWHAITGDLPTFEQGPPG